MGKPKEKKPFGKSRCRRENNIKMDLQEMGWSMGWINLAHSRDRWRAAVHTVLNLRVP